MAAGAVEPQAARGVRVVRGVRAGGQRREVPGERVHKVTEHRQVKVLHVALRGAHRRLHLTHTLLRIAHSEW